MSDVIEPDQLLQRFREDADRQFRKSLLELDPVGIGWLAVVPRWTMALASEVELPTGKLTLRAMLDHLTDIGACERTPAFMPGELELTGATEPVGGNTFFQDLSSTLGLARPAADPSAVETIRTSTSALRCRSDAITLTVMSAPPVRTAMRAEFHSLLGARDTLADFLQDSPSEFACEVSAQSGNDWSGYELTLTVSERDRSRFAQQLYREFQVSDARRADVIQAVTSLDWRMLCHSVAARIYQVRSQRKVPAPRSVRQWVTLALRLDRGTSYVASRILRRIDLLLTRGRAGEALAFIDVARQLALVLAADIESAVRIAERRLEIHHRKQVDRRRLQHFLAPAGQLEAAQALMTGKNATWALHYIGIAGVGKTMLLRFLNQEFRNQNVAIARIDFDYLDADYPARRPGQLLIELADSLRAEIQSDAAESAFRSFELRVDTLHRDLESVVLSSDPLTALHSEVFTYVHRAFVDLLQSLSRPVVLLLDTCEELLRLQANGRFQPGVQATFEIIERLAQDLGREAILFRVIFAGRRMLAYRGHGWKIKGAHVSERRQQYALESGGAVLEKPYLLLQPVHGFTADEALRYLRLRSAPSSPGAPSTEVEDAILRRSIEPTSVVDFEWEDGRARPTGPFYNPFDLALYADWRAEEPGLTADTIRRGGHDPYIQLRIIDRLKDSHVLQVLPSLLILRRVNRTWLAQLFSLQGQYLENLYCELCRLEWIDYQGNDDFTKSWLEIDRHLRPRLEKYYERPRYAAEMTNARRRILSWLELELKREGDLRPSAPLVSLAVRLLPTTQSAPFWSKLENLVARDGEWHWAREICEHLLGEDGPISPALSAAVMATLAAAQLRVGDREVGPLWEQVEANARHHPKLGDELRNRAVAGLLTLRLRENVMPPPADFRRLRALMKDSPGPEWGMVIEAFVNLMDQTGTVRQDDAFTRTDLWRWYQKLRTSRPLSTLALSLCLRAEPFLRGGTGANDREIRLRELLEAATNGFERSPNPAITAPDWILPCRLEERARLEALDLTTAGAVRHLTLEPNTLLSWAQDALEFGEYDDSRWLLARILQTLRNSGGQELHTIADATTKRFRQFVLDSPKTPAQRNTPPLFLALAEALSALQRPEAALAILDAQLDRGALSPSLTRQVLEAKAKVIIEHSLFDRAKLFVLTLRNSAVDPDPTLLRALEELAARDASQRRRFDPVRWQVRRLIDQIGRDAISTVGALAILVTLVGVVSLRKSATSNLHTFTGGVLLVSWLFCIIATLIRSRSPRTFMYLAGIARYTYPIFMVITGILVLQLDQNSETWLEDVLTSCLFTIVISFVVLRWINTWESITRKGGDAELCLRLQPSLRGTVLAELHRRRAPTERIAKEAASLKAIVAFVRTLFRRPITQEAAVRAAWHADVTTIQGTWPQSRSDAGKSDPSRAIARGLNALLQVRDAAWLPLAIQTEPPLGSEPWETRLSGWLNTEESDGRGQLMPFRHAPPLHRSHIPPRWHSAEPDAPVHFLLWPNWRIPFREAWTRGFGSNLWTQAVEVVARWTPFTSNSPQNFRICHIVGESFTTHGGYRVRWSAKADESSDLTVASPEQLLRTERGLFILQELPLPFGERSGTARERTAAMRGFADELFRGGAWAVLVLPPLPPAVAQEAIQMVAKRCGRWRAPHCSLLLHTVQRIRRMVQGTLLVNGVDEVPSNLRPYARALSWEITFFGRNSAHEFSGPPSERSAIKR